jgi:hypothetical protein
LKLFSSLFGNCLDRLDLWVNARRMAQRPVRLSRAVLPDGYLSAVNHAGGGSRGAVGRCDPRSKHAEEKKRGNQKRFQAAAPIPWPKPITIEERTSRIDSLRCRQLKRPKGSQQIRRGSSDSDRRMCSPVCRVHFMCLRWLRQ